MAAQTEASEEGSKVKMASSKTRVKSKARRHPFTIGPKARSASGAQLEAMTYGREPGSGANAVRGIDWKVVAPPGFQLQNNEGDFVRHGYQGRA